MAHAALDAAGRSAVLHPARSDSRTAVGPSRRPRATLRHSCSCWCATAVRSRISCARGPLATPSRTLVSGGEMLIFHECEGRFSSARVLPVLPTSGAGHQCSIGMTTDSPRIDRSDLPRVALFTPGLGTRDARVGGEAVRQDSLVVAGRATTKPPGARPRCVATRSLLDIQRLLVRSRMYVPLGDAKMGTDVVRRYGRVRVRGRRDQRDHCGQQHQRPLSPSRGPTRQHVRVLHDSVEPTRWRGDLAARNANRSLLHGLRGPAPQRTRSSRRHST